MLVTLASGYPFAIFLHKMCTVQCLHGDVHVVALYWTVMAFIIVLNSFIACCFQQLNSVFPQKELFNCISSCVICGSEKAFKRSIIVFFESLLSVICNVLIKWEEFRNMAIYCMHVRGHIFCLVYIEKDSKLWFDISLQLKYVILWCKIYSFKSINSIIFCQITWIFLFWLYRGRSVGIES